MTDPGTTRGFLEELFGAKRDELYLLIWTLADKRSRWFRDLPAAASAVETLAGQDVYVGVGLSPKDHGPTQRCPSQEIAGIVGLWADLDLRSEAHSKKALPATIQDALAIIPEPLAPTMLAAIGARNITVKGKTFKPQSRWLLPVEEFNPADFTIQPSRQEPFDAH